MSKAESPSSAISPSGCVHNRCAANMRVAAASNPSMRLRWARSGTALARLNKSSTFSSTETQMATKKETMMDLQTDSHLGWNLETLMATQKEQHLPR